MPVRTYIKYSLPKFQFSKIRKDIPWIYPASCGKFSGVFFSASDGYLYVYNKDNGELLDRRCVGAPSFVKVVRFGDRLVAADFAGNVISFAI